MEISRDENDNIDYFDEEFLDYLKKSDNGQVSAFSKEFIGFKILELIQEYQTSKGVLQTDIEKNVGLVKQVLKNPDIELIDSIVFNTIVFSNS